MGFKLTAAARRRVIMMWADCVPRVTGEEVQAQARMRMVRLPTVDVGTPPFTDEVCICISPCFEPSVTVGVYTSIKCPLTQTDGIYIFHTPPPT